MSAPIGQKRQRYDSDSDVEETTTVQVVRDNESSTTSAIPPKSTPDISSSPPVSGPPATTASKGKRRAAPTAMVFAAGRATKAVTTSAPSTSNLISGAPTALSLIERMKNQIGGGGMGDVGPSSSSSLTTSTNITSAKGGVLLDEGTLFNHGKQTQAFDDALNNLTPNKKTEEEGGSSGDDAEYNSSLSNNRLEHFNSNAQATSSSSAATPHPSKTSPKQSSKTAPIQLEDPSARDVIRKVRSDDRAWARSLQVGGTRLGGGEKKPLLLASVVEYSGDAGFVDEDLGKSNSRSNHNCHTNADGVDDTSHGRGGGLSTVTRALQIERLKDGHDRLGYRLLRAQERVDTIASVIGFGGEGSVKGEFTEDISTTSTSTTKTAITATHENINQLLVVELNREPLLAEYATLVQNGSIHCSFVGDNTSTGGFLVNGRGGIGMNSGTGLSVADLRGHYSSSLDDRHYMLGPLHSTATLASGSDSKITSPTSPSGPGALPLPAVVTKDRFGVPVQQVPQEYEIAASGMMGMERVCSGWRWDGIIRGNPRILDHYRPHHNHSLDHHGL